MSATNRMTLGRRGEQLAVQHLEARGAIVVAHNWHCVGGEIDIIARDGVTWIFVEVRARRAETTDEAFAGITARKQAVLRRAALTWLAQQDAADAEWRIDVIAIAFPKTGLPLLDHVQDALAWTD